MPNTYGNSGNRWYVAENITDQNSFRLSNFGSNNAPSGYQSLPAGSAADDAVLAKAASTNGTANLHNIDWVNVHGPYTSQAQANAAIPGIQSASPAAGALQQATGVNPNVFSSIENGISAFYDKLTDGKMWRSLGWILLGILLIFIGLALLGVPYFLRKSPAALAAKAVGNA